MIHAELLQRLLPAVAVAPNGAALLAELRAEGAALDLAEGQQILAEADPRSTALLLTDWERVYGLPEACIVQSGVAQSIAERRAALVAKVAMRGGQSRAFFIALAASIGYAITITELFPENTEHNTEVAVMDEQYRFIWQVNAALYSLREETTEDDTEMALAVWGNQLLQCVLNRYKPAHTYILFSYT
jgi:uncharacterized protein YmfQ (DUF2313 family)